MKKFNMRTIYIVLFTILYICVGLVSTIHAVSFFSLANGAALAVILAGAFEIGQAAVLFSILTDIRKRKQFMPWLLMSVLTIVQILGNIYASYKYLITNSEANLRFFKEPIFTWVADMPDQNANVLLVYIIGAILPIVSLLMTAMLTSYLEKDEQRKEEEIEEEEEDEEEVEETKERKPLLQFQWLKKKQVEPEPEEDETKDITKIHIGDKTYAIEEDPQHVVPALEDTPGKMRIDDTEDIESEPEEEQKEYIIEPEEEHQDAPEEPENKTTDGLESHFINM